LRRQGVAVEEFGVHGTVGPAGRGNAGCGLPFEGQE
jgi:hypothetical protein